MADAAVSFFDAETDLAKFLADPGQSILELPSLTCDQRKQMKQLAQQYPDLKCESFGFGVGRQLHIFKTNHAGGVKPMLFDDCKTNQAGAVASQSDQAGGMKPMFFDDWVALKRSQLAPEQDADQSTSASCASSNASVTSSSSSSRSWIDLAEPMRVQVRHTFLEFPEECVDERIVQSLPHNMFRQCLHDEYTRTAVAASIGVPPGLVAPAVEAESVHAVAAEARAPTREMETPSSSAACAKDQLLVPGMQAVIGGLLKQPQFNGLTGTVDSMDKESGRYNMAIPSSGGYEQLKVKSENLWVVKSSPPPGLEYNFPGAGGCMSGLEKRASVLATIRMSNRERAHPEPESAAKTLGLIKSLPPQSSKDNLPSALEKHASVLATFGLTQLVPERHSSAAEMLGLIRPCFDNLPSANEAFTASTGKRRRRGAHKDKTHKLNAPTPLRLSNLV